MRTEISDIYVVISSALLCPGPILKIFALLLVDIVSYWYPMSVTLW